MLSPTVHPPMGRMAITSASATRWSSALLPGSRSPIGETYPSRSHSCITGRIGACSNSTRCVHHLVLPTRVSILHPVVPGWSQCLCTCSNPTATPPYARLNGQPNHTLMPTGVRYLRPQRTNAPPQHPTTSHQFHASKIPYPTLNEHALAGSRFFPGAAGS